MQSSWMAAVYAALWRPVFFDLSMEAELTIVLDALRGCGTPWLDLSCGPGTSTRGLLEAAAHDEPRRAVVAVDLSRAMLKRAARAAPESVRVRADATELPFDDDVFGAVVNLAALDLYREPARAVTEAARVLSPGGRIVLSSFLSESACRSARVAPCREAVLAWLRNAGLWEAGSVSLKHYLIIWADKPPAKG